MDVAKRKQELREQLKAQRKAQALNLEHASDLLQNLAEICLANGVATVACYLPFGTEPDTELFIDWALENDLRVLLPVSNSDGTLLWINFTGETAPGIFGFAEPVGDVVSAKEIDLAIIPAMAADKKGNRLGKGKGYYDRALQELRNGTPVVAVVYAHELLEQIPTENHDHPLDAVVTPAGVTRFTRRLN
jgi:5-formyltetrahydrofolate cyclo-ligase